MHPMMLFLALLAATAQTEQVDVARLISETASQYDLANKIREIPNGIQETRRIFPKLEAIDRRKTVRMWSTLGWKPEKTGDREPHFFWVTDEVVIEALIDALEDKDQEVRRLARDALVERVKDKDLTRYADRVVETIRKSPYAPGFALLLGKVRTDAARKLLQNEKLFAPTETTTKLALARLGDRKLTEKYVKEFHDADRSRGVGDVKLGYDYTGNGRPISQEVAAMNLSYIGSDEALRVLAQEMRTSAIASLPDGSRHSMRVPLIRALSRAMPDEQVLWRLRNGGVTDSYYQQIEEFLEKRFKIKWDQSRPAFFYEMPAIRLLPR